MCCCDSDPPDVYEATSRKARKPHRCDECGRTIARGESYRHISGLWDGDWMAFRLCAHCLAASEILDEAIGDFCFCLGGLWEAAGDHRGGWQRATNRLIYRLCMRAERKWTIRRGRRAGELMTVPSPI